jgi:transposase
MTGHHRHGHVRDGHDLPKGGKNLFEPRITGDYWKPVFYLLEAQGLDPWLVNAKDVKHLPGRPKTDKLDAVWLCKIAERQMIRPSFVPPPQIRRLRDVTRYRIDLVGVRTAEKQRVEKLLEDAPLTELLGSVFVSARRFTGCVATVPLRDWSSGCAVGSCVVGRAPLRVGSGDRRGVRAVSAG